MKFRALNFDYHADAALHVLEDWESNRSQRRSSIIRLLPSTVVATSSTMAAVDVASTEENNEASSSLSLRAADCSSSTSSSMNDDEMNVNDNNDDATNDIFMHDNDEYVDVEENDMECIEKNEPNKVKLASKVENGADSCSSNLLDQGLTSTSSTAAAFDYLDDDDYDGGRITHCHFEVDDDDDDEVVAELVQSKAVTAKTKLKKSRRVIDDSDDDDDEMTEPLQQQQEPLLHHLVALKHHQQQLKKQPDPPPHHHQQQQNHPVPRHGHQQQQQQQQHNNNTKEMKMQWKQIVQSIIVSTGRKRISDKPWHDVNKEIILTQKRSRHRQSLPQQVIQGQMPLLPPLHALRDSTSTSSNDCNRLYVAEQHLDHILQLRRNNNDNMNLSSLLQPKPPAPFSFSMLHKLLDQESGGRFAPVSWSIPLLPKKRGIRRLPLDEAQQQQSSLAIVPYLAGNKRKAENEAEIDVCESSAVQQQQQQAPPLLLPQPWQFAVQLAMAALYHHLQPAALLAKSSSSSSLPPAVATRGERRQGTETGKPTATLESNVDFIPQQRTAIITEMERQHDHDVVKANNDRKVNKTNHPSSPHAEQDRATATRTTVEATSRPTATTHHHQESMMGFPVPNRQPQKQRPGGSSSSSSSHHIPEQEQGLTIMAGDAKSCAATMHEATSIEFADHDSSGGQQPDFPNKSSSSNGCTSFQLYCKTSKRTGHPENGSILAAATKPAAEPDSTQIDAPDKVNNDAEQHQKTPPDEDKESANHSEEQVSDGQESFWDGPTTMANTGRVSFSDFVQYARNNPPLEQDEGAIKMDATSTVPAEPLMLNGIENQPEQAKSKKETKSERKERKRLKKEKRRLKKNERKLERGRSRERSGDGNKEKRKRRRLSHAKATAKDPPTAAAGAGALASSGHHQPSQKEPAMVPTHSGNVENKQNQQRASSEQPPPELSAESGNYMAEKKDVGEPDGVDVYARWTNVDDQLQRARNSLMAKPPDSKIPHKAANLPRGQVTSKASTKLQHSRRTSLKAPPPPATQQNIHGSALGVGQSKPNPLVPWTAATTSRSKVVPGRNSNGPPNGAPLSHNEGGQKDKSIQQTTFPAARKDAPRCSQQDPAQTTQELPRSVAENSRKTMDGSRQEPGPPIQFSNEHHRKNEHDQSSAFPQNSVANALAPPGGPFNSFPNTAATTSLGIDNDYLGDRPTLYHLLEPVGVLCSESFLETWGTVVGDLSSGKWASAPPPATEEATGLAFAEFNLGQRIELLDTPLVDQCGVDMELPNRCGILLYNVSELEGDQARSIILNLAKTASIGRYENLFVFLCYDTAPTSTATRHVLQLQTAVIRQDDIAPTSTLFKTVSPRSLAAALAETILSQVQRCCGNDDILQAGVSDDLLRQRAQFLLSLIPSLCARGAIQCIQLARQLCSNGMSDEEPLAFGALFQNARLQQQIHLASTSEPSGAPEIHRDAMVQLSHVLRVSITAKRGT